VEDQAPSFVILGGPPTLQAATRRYLSLQGWDVPVLALDGCSSRAAGIELCGTVVDGTPPAGCILILAPDRDLAGRPLERRLRTAGRKVEVPFRGLGMAGMLTWLEKRIARAKAERRPAGKTIARLRSGLARLSLKR
jgi:hypothetical protein